MSDIGRYFQTLYDQIPDPGCRGLCQEACGPIDMHPYERARIRRAGVTIPTPADAVKQLLATGSYTCPALDNGRCGAYEVRPTLCRLYGAAEELKCEHGCRPAGGHLPAQDAQRILALSQDPTRAG